MIALTLVASDFLLVLTPERGGSVSRFEWRGQPLFRSTCGESILDTACFPLVPFSNRIAHGRFYADGRAVTLPANFPSSNHPHALHGFGWLDNWETVEATACHAKLTHAHRVGAWPWSYEAEQCFTLCEDGLLHELSVTNLGTTPMPAGLGVHPYFPRNAQTVYHGAHRGEWQTDDDGLPRSVARMNRAIDWWNGCPAERRCVDTVYEGREGPLSIHWPDRNLTLRIEPSPELGFTTVYVPPARAFLCVEPVSHATDAVNMRTGGDGLRLLSPGETFGVSVTYTIRQH